MRKNGKKSEESVEEKSLKWKRDFEEKRHIYAIILGPIFDVQRLLGRAPFYRDKNGNMQFKIFSGIALYSIFIYLLLSTTALLSILDINQEVRISFIGVINRNLAISLIVPQLVMPILSWIHLKRMQTYFDLWFTFQEKFEKVTESSFPQLTELKPPIWKIVTHYIGTGIVIIIALPYYLRKNLQWYQLPAFYAGILTNLLHFWYWIMTAQVITVVAKKYHSRLREEILKGKGYTLKIEEYRLLWIDLNYLIRESGSCNGLAVSFFILSNMLTLIFFTYNSIFRLPKFLRENKYNSVLSALAVTAFFWNYMITYCDAGYRMTECSFRGIFDNLALLQRDGSFREELYISMFLSTIRSYPAKAVISEFFVVNRAFFGSISTYLVTLIIVLEQFHIGRNSMESESVQPAPYLPVSAPSS